MVGDWYSINMDVKFVFLNGIIEEEVEQPMCHVVKGQEDKFLKFYKRPFTWWKKQQEHVIAESITTLKNYKKCSYEHTLHIKIKYGDVMIFSLYVDDMIFIENNLNMF